MRRAARGSRSACAFSLRLFGPRVIKPSPLLKACGPLFDHKDKSVRDGAKDIAVRRLVSCWRCLVRCPHACVLSQRARQVEMTRWMGAAAVKRDLTDKMRDAQKKEARRVLRVRCRRVLTGNCTLTMLHRCRSLTG